MVWRECESGTGRSCGEEVREVYNLRRVNKGPATLCRVSMTRTGVPGRSGPQKRIGTGGMARSSMKSMRLVRTTHGPDLVPQVLRLSFKRPLYRPAILFRPLSVPVLVLR